MLAEFILGCLLGRLRRAGRILGRLHIRTKAPCGPSSRIFGYFKPVLPDVKCFSGNFSRLGGSRSTREKKHWSPSNAKSPNGSGNTCRRGVLNSEESAQSVSKQGPGILTGPSRSWFSNLTQEQASLENAKAILLIFR
jgi:hypothetical protein